MGEKSYRICPKCKLTCPKSQKVCDCGYVFRDDEEGLTEEQFKKKQTWKWTLICLSVLIGGSFLFIRAADDKLLSKLLGIALIAFVVVIALIQAFTKKKK